MNFFHHKDLGNYLLQLCPKVVKHPVYYFIYNILVSYYNVLRVLFRMNHHRTHLITTIKKNINTF